MKKILILSLCAAALFFTACEIPETDDDTAAPSAETIDTTQTPPIGQISPPTVYVAGYENNTSDISIAKYWKDGVETELPVPTVDSYTFEGAEANSIFVNGTDIYIAGEISYMDADSTVYNSAAYWKDDGISIETVILDEAWTSGLESWANDIFVSGNDVYVVGSKQIAITFTEYARLWTNGAETTLVHDEHPTKAKAVFVDGSDVYVAGQGKTSLTGRYRAIYWLNGTRNVIGTDGIESCFEDILVDGTDVYAAGWQEDPGDGIPFPFYWKKDGEFTSLPDADSNMGQGRAYGIAIDGSDIYTTGYLGSFYAAHFWENENAKSIAETGTASIGYSIAVESNHVFIAGHTGQYEADYIAAYWECEKSPGTAYVKTTLGVNKSDATSIFVVK